jgi:predicted Zn-dependent protease
MQRAIGTSEDFPMYVCMYADVLVATGHADRAVEELSHGLEHFEALGLSIWAPEVWRSLGDAILAADPGAIDAAAKAYEQSARIAAEQGAAMLALRVAFRRVKLELTQGVSGSARAFLAAALDDIAERDESAELQEAKALAESIGLPGKDSHDRCQ